MEVFHGEAGAPGFGMEAFRRRQHAAREDVLLDEVGAAAVVVEAGIVDGDALHGGAATGAQAFLHLLEIRGPPGFAHGLEHLDRHHGIVLALEVAVVAELEVAAAFGRRAAHAFARPRQLFARQRDAGHVAATGQRRMFGQRTPAAADFKDVVAALHLEQVEQAVVLGVLGVTQAGRIVQEQRRRVGHRIVQPQPVEVVADVVVGVDVLLAA